MKPESKQKSKKKAENRKNPYQIFFAAPLLLGVLAITFATLSWRQFDIFQDAYLTEVESELHFQCEMASNAVRKFLQNGEEAQMLDFCQTYVGNPRRITVLDSSGDVLFDSDQAPGGMENHLKRPEIQKVLQTHEAASAIHYSETMQTWMLYVARPFEVDGKTHILRVSVPMRPISELLARVVWNIALALLVGAGMVTFLTCYIVFQLRFPLAKLQESAARIAAGDFSAAVFVPKKGVTRELALAIAEMAKQLRLRIGELVRLESFRSDFIANVSHEIKTPLTGILSAVEMLEDGAKDAPTMRDRCLEILEHQAHRLHSLVQDILSLAALEQKRKNGEENFMLVSPLAILKSAISACAEAALEGHTELQIVRQDDVSFLGDAQLLEQAITNLIINAIRYSGSPRIELAVEFSPRRSESDVEEIIFSVRDFGIGIAEEHSTRIFERFYRVHKERSREMGGTGLGLAIVKHTAQLHDGCVELKSSPGKGADFRIIIPLKREKTEKVLIS